VFQEVLLVISGSAEQQSVRKMKISSACGILFIVILF